MVWHGMTWGAGAGPKGPDLGEARAEATSGVAGGSEPPPRPGRGRRRAEGAEAAAAVEAGDATNG